MSAINIKNLTPTSKAILIYIIVSLFLCFEMAVQVSPSVMTNDLMKDLGINAFGLGLMSGFYFYTYTLMQLPVGLLFDRFNARVVIVIPLLICTLGAFLFAFSQDIVMGTLARLLMGAGSAFAFVAVLVVVANLFAAKQFAFLTGITQMLAALGAMSGELPLSQLVASVGWRSAMVGFASIGLFLTLMVWLLVKYPTRPIEKTENIHSVTISLKKIMTSSQTWYIAIYACLLWAPMSAFASLWGVPFLMGFDHLSHQQAASVCSLMWLGLALASPILGWLSTYYARRNLALIASAVIGILAFALILFIPNLSTWILGVALFFAGAACAGQALSFSVIKENNLRPYQATAIALNNMAVVVSGAIFQPLIGKLLQTNWDGVVDQAIPIYSSVNFQNSLLIILACYIVAFLVATFFVKETYARQITDNQYEKPQDLVAHSEI